MSGPGRFGAEFMPIGSSENYVNPPTLDVNKVGLPYTNASNHILRMTLAARDEVLAIKADLEMLQAASGSDIAELTARP